MSVNALVRARLAPVLTLLLLAPVCAEYLLGYDSSTGDIAALAGGLIVLAPLYGAAAVVIREVARRYNLGWPGILWLSGAWGLLEAGVIDQSIFNPDYRGIEYWDLLWHPTQVPGLGLSVFALVTFVGGHVAFSLGAPIALVEALFPQSVPSPWLGRAGTLVMIALAVCGAALVAADHRSTEPFSATPAQLGGVVLAAAAMVTVPWLLRRRQLTPPGPPSLPRSTPIVLGVVALAVAGIVQGLLPTTWAATAGLIIFAVAAVVVCTRLARSPDWGGAHVLALASGLVLGSCAAGFFIQPIGDVSAPARWGHHVVFTSLIVAVVWMASRHHKQVMQGRF